VTPKNFDDIRDFVETCCAKRAAPDAPSYSKPSEYWAYFIDEFRYVFQLQDAELRRIRYHTYHLTGDYYCAYTHQPPATFAPLRQEYSMLVRETGGFRASEGPLGFGHDIDGEKVTVDTVRYMQVIADLHRSGVLDRTHVIRMLEVGGGYGGLARSVMQYNPRIAYAICDLEETMFFQAVHLCNSFGFEAVELCPDGITPGQAFFPGRFYLIPQRCADTIPPSSIDIVVNQQSLQEMTPDQVQHYFNVIDQTARYFYSCNSQHDSSLTGRLQIVTRLQSMIDGHFPRLRWQSRARIAGNVAQKLGKLLKLLTGQPIRRVGDFNLRRVLYEVGPGAR
jgi:hypothetical protein